MSNHTPIEADAILDRQIATLKQASIPAGPSPALAAETLRRLESAAATPPRRSQWFRMTRQPLLRLAAAVLIIVGLYALLAAPLGGRSIAFAQVASQIKAARSIAYTVSTSVAGGPTMTAKVIHTADGRSRRELPGGAIMIQNRTRTLMLTPSDHVATTYTSDAPAPAEPSTAQRVLDSFRDLQTPDARLLGEKQLDGHTVRGFTATLAGLPVNVWADAKTADPVRMEWSTSVAGQAVDIVMSDFQLDVPLEESMFSVDPPTGYTVKTEQLPTLAAANVPQALADLLRDYTRLGDGTFPDHLDNWNAFINVSTKLPPDQRQALIGRVGTISAHLFSRPYHYAGKEVKLGDKDAMIFWFTPKKGETTTQVIYGDLRVETVAAEKLPAGQNK